MVKLVYYILLHQLRTDILDSIVVSISACHADDPGSIPGRGDFFLHCHLEEIPIEHLEEIPIEPKLSDYIL